MSRYDNFGPYRGGSRDRSWSSGYRPRGYGRDYWWLGEHEIRRQGGYDRGFGYDSRYVRFDRDSRPRYSPVGGTYPAMGGRFAYRRQPGPMRDEMWFSDWTRWF